jgi:hypothetical protein
VKAEQLPALALEPSVARAREAKLAAAQLAWWHRQQEGRMLRQLPRERRASLVLVGFNQQPVGIA